MKKSYIRGFFLVIFLGACTAVSLAADGKALYRANCKVCHDKGSPNGEYSPLSLTQDQWTRFFTEKLAPSHETAVQPDTGKKLMESVSPKDMKAIQKFCVDHAADSEQPATCG